MIGGQTDESDNYIAPTIMVDVKPTDPIMQDEVCTSDNDNIYFLYSAIPTASLLMVLCSIIIINKY